MSPAAGGGSTGGQGAKGGVEEFFQRRREDPDKPWFTWPRFGLLIALLLFTFFVGRGCQERQVKIDQDQAVELARQEVDFKPTLTQVRFIRQGLNRTPFWFVSLSIPVEGQEGAPDEFERLVVIGVDANKGTVETVDEGTEAVEADREAREEAEEPPEDPATE